MLIYGFHIIILYHEIALIIITNLKILAKAIITIQKNLPVFLILL